MAIEFNYTSITSTGGETVNLPTAGVVCIVGGNNVGKSQLLRELRERANESPQDPGAVVAQVTATMPTGTEDESKQWLEQKAIRYDRKPGEPDRFGLRFGDSATTVAEFHSWVNPRPHRGAYLGNIAPFFVEYAGAGVLGRYAAGFIEPRLTGSSQNYALMKLRGSGDLEAALSDVLMEAFGTRIVLDRLDIQTQLRVGAIDVAVPLLNRPTDDYASALAALPTLDSQGDGLRSFVGIASQVLTHHVDVLLIDEPEAFLHPGQSRVLGRWIAEQAATRDMQVIAATHDRDFVLGLLSASSATPVTLVRLTRDSDATHFVALAPDEVKDMWSDPVLRYSNVLQALFHRKVIVCESDADCRFYGAALDSVAIRTGLRSIADDTLLVPAAGKTGIPNVLAAVARLGVEAWAFPDFDVLTKKQDIRKIVEAVGAQWSAELDELYMRFVKEPNQSASWKALKHSGLNALPAGDSYQAGMALLDRLTALRVRVVPLGEMESFDKSLTGHGTPWVSAALAAGTHESTGLADFVAPVLSI